MTTAQRWLAPIQGGRGYFSLSFFFPREDNVDAISNDLMIVIFEGVGPDD